MEAASETGLAQAWLVSVSPSTEILRQHILEDFVTAIAYAPTYAQWLLNHVEEVCALPQALHRRYGLEVLAAVLVAWILVCSYHLV
jgi:hypothetical protein